MGNDEEPLRGLRSPCDERITDAMTMTDDRVRGVQHIIVDGRTFFGFIRAVRQIMSRPQDPLARRLVEDDLQREEGDPEGPPPDFRPGIRFWDVVVDDVAILGVKPA